MEDNLQRDNVAEIALTSMVSMIMILLFSAIVAGMALMMIEQAFMESKSQSTEQSKTLNSIPVILSFEMESFNSVDNANERLYITFKFPYSSESIPDTDVKWALICDNGNPVLNSQRNVELSEGDFDFATDLNGNGLDQNALDEFETGGYYHMIIRVDSPNGNGRCDLQEGLLASFIIAIENGRTTQIDFVVPENVEPGYDLMGSV